MVIQMRKNVTRNRKRKKQDNILRKGQRQTTEFKLEYSAQSLHYFLHTYVLRN